MSVEIRQFNVTIPAGTTKASGFTSDMSFPARTVTQIDIFFPPGPRGEVGVGVGTAGVITVPYGGAGYIVSDDHLFELPLEQAVNSGSWTFFGYNTGTFAHTITVTFHLALNNTGAAAPGGGVIPPGQLSGGDGSGAGPGAPPPPPPSPPPPVAPPPVAPPPVTPPGISGPPLTLPPAVPTLPGTAGPSVDPGAETMLFGVPDLGQVWLLDASHRYTQVTTQDDLSALVAVVDVAANVSAAMHAAVYAAASSLALTLGGRVLAGQLTIAHTSGH